MKLSGMFANLISSTRPVVVIVLIWGAFSPPSSGQEAPAASISQLRLEETLSSGSFALQQGNNVEAEADFRRALAISPNSIMILNNLAIALARQQREQEAVTVYERALELEPGDPVTRRNLGVAYFRGGQYGLALPLLETYAKATPTFQALDITGLDLFALDRYEEAVRFLEEASVLAPKDLPTLNMLGKAYLRTKNYSGITDVFGRILSLDPNSPDAHFMLGMADDKLFKEKDAIKEFKAAIAVDPHYPGANTALGVIYWRTNDLDSAVTAFREELSRYPTDPVANCTLGRILQRRDRPQDAISYLQKALAVNPSYRDALLALGEVNVSLNQPADAVMPLRKAIALDADDAEAHYLLGSTLIKLGQTAEGAKERQTCGRIRTAERSAAAQRISAAGK